MFGRAEVEMAEDGGNKLTPLQEAWNDVVVPWDADYDGIRADVLTWGNNSLTRLQRPITSLYDRMDGRNIPVFENETDLLMQRSLARFISEASPPVKNGLDNLDNFVFKAGFTFTASPDPTAISPDPYQVEVARRVVQREINAILAANQFTAGLDREIHRQSRVDGESTIQVRMTATGMPKILRREPEQLRMPANTGELERWLGCDGKRKSWSFGVFTEYDEPETPLGYHFVYDEMGQSWDFVDAADVVHIKRNVVRRVKRGVSDLFSVQPDADRENKITRNTAEGAAIQSAIAYIRQHAKGVTQSGVTQLQATNAVRTVQQPTATGTRATNVSKATPGTILDISAGLEYQSGPMGSERAPNFLLINAYLSRRMGIRWQMPEYMISGDASNANFASTFEAGGPFVVAREFDQQFYSESFIRVLWICIRKRYEAGKMTDARMSLEAIKLLIVIKAGCPKVAVRDRKEQVEAQQIEMQMGAVSARTVATENGRDYDYEVANGAAPQAAAGAGAAGAPSPGMGGDPNAPPVPGGEFSSASTLQVNRNIKQIERARERYNAGLITYQDAMFWLTTVGLTVDRAEQFLNGLPDAEIDAAAAADAKDSQTAAMEAIREAIAAGQVTVKKTVDPGFPKGIPNQEDFIFDATQKMHALIERLGDAVADDDKPAMKLIRRQIDALQEATQAAAAVLGVAAIFKPAVLASPKGGPKAKVLRVDPEAK
jgi:hypothetical protein